jgi:hypothetical protein
MTRCKFWGFGLCSCNLLAEANEFGLGGVLLSCLVSEIQKTSSLGIEPRTVFHGCCLCFCNLPFEINEFGLGTVLLSGLVTEIQKTSSTGIEPRTVIQGCGHRLCNFLFETNKSGLGAVLSCLISELQEPPSPGQETQDIFSEFRSF